MPNALPDTEPTVSTWTTEVVNILFCENWYVAGCIMLLVDAVVVVPLVIFLALAIYKCRCTGCPPSQTDERQPLLQPAEPTYTGL